MGLLRLLKPMLSQPTVTLDYCHQFLLCRGLVVRVILRSIQPSLRRRNHFNGGGGLTKTPMFIDVSNGKLRRETTKLRVFK